MSSIERIDSLSTIEGRYSFTTESNSTYHVRIAKDKRTLIRIPQENNSKNNLRKDNQELKIVGEFSIEVGKPAIFVLEALGSTGDCTIRRTNLVKTISCIH